jgi:hypothetical protein
MDWKQPEWSILCGARSSNLSIFESKHSGCLEMAWRPQVIEASGLRKVGLVGKKAGFCSELFQSMMEGTFDICQRWPISSGEFNQVQLDVWDLKMSGKSFETIREIIARDANDQISTASLWVSIKRTATGHQWTPHMEGREPYLNLDEMASLAAWLNEEPNEQTLEDMLDAVVDLKGRGVEDLAAIILEMGCPKILEKMREEVQLPSRAWGYEMLSELNMKLRSPERLENARAEYATSALILRWFRDMSPEVAGCERPLIFNFDESMLFVQSKAKVIVTGSKKAFRKKAPTGPHLTVGLCFSPLGVHPPPLIILPTLRRVTDFEYLQSCNLVQIENSPSGWMTYELFVKWAHGFCKWLENYRQTLPADMQQRTAILFIDNCRTHCARDALLLFANNNVKVISFPPHLTHVLQPVDVGCVRPFKVALCKNAKYFDKHLETFFHTDSAAARQRALLVLSTISSLNACDFRVCSNAFRKAGLCPFSSTEPLNTPYVTQSDVDPEAVHRQKRPNLFHSGSSVMTSQEFLDRLQRQVAQLENMPPQ